MKRKGFTLIELLAVIVILAVIALIATPIILNMINDARKSSAVDSSYGYIEAVEYENQMNMLDDKKYPKIEDGVDIDALSTLSKINLKGTAPTSGKVTIKSGRVTSAELCIDKYLVSYENNKSKVTGSCGTNGSSSGTTGGTSGGSQGGTTGGNQGGTSGGSGGTQGGETSYSVYSAGQVVYLDPQTGKKCTNYTDGQSLTSTVTGCLKWYVITTNDSSANKNISLILDHNSTMDSISGSNISSDIKTHLSGLVTKNSWKNTPRIISVDEVAAITGADKALNYKFSTATTGSWFYLDGASGTDSTWHTKVASDTNISKYHWLYDYTQNCKKNKLGCMYEDSFDTNGFWQGGYYVASDLNSNLAIIKGEVMAIISSGSIDYRTEKVLNINGVRPVITVEKTNLD